MQNTVWTTDKQVGRIKPNYVNKDKRGLNPVPACLLPPALSQGQIFRPAHLLIWNEYIVGESAYRDQIFGESNGDQISAVRIEDR